jgi:hypothetical protein
MILLLPFGECRLEWAEWVRWTPRRVQLQEHGSRERGAWRPGAQFVQANDRWGVPECVLAGIEVGRGCAVQQTL